MGSERDESTQPPGRSARGRVGRAAAASGRGTNRTSCVQSTLLPRRGSARSSGSRPTRTRRGRRRTCVCSRPSGRSPISRQVEGEAGHVDPVQAVEDALREFPADEILIVGGPSEDGGLEASLRRFRLPVTRLGGSLPEPEHQQLRETTRAIIAGHSRRRRSAIRTRSRPHATEPAGDSSPRRSGTCSPAPSPSLRQAPPTPWPPDGP
jgi:hypothetical protein